MQMETHPETGQPTNLEHNYYRKCLPPHSANPPCPGQTTTGTYLAQLSCTMLQPTSEQTVTSTTQSTSEIKPAQENHLNSKCTMPTGKHNPNIVLWTVPGSSIQIFVPVNNMSLQETNNGPNISHCAPRPGTEAFNYYNGVCMQQQTTSVPAGPNSCQHYPTKTINNRSLNEHTNASNNFPQDPSTKRMTLPFDSRYYPTTTNAPNGQISPLGGSVHHRLTADHANLQALSTCKQNIQQNNATKKAVAVVTPLSPIEMASVILSNKSAYALDARSVPVHHLPSFTHPLEVNSNLQTMRELNDPTSKHERPKSTEPRLDSHVVKSPVCLLESTSQPNHASLPKLNSAATDQNKSAEIQKEASEMMPKDNHAGTDKKTNTGEADKNSTVPVIEWPLDKLHTLMNIIQQVEDGHQKKLNKTDAGKEILRLYWNGDFHKFRSKAQTGVYENVMEEVYNYCQKKDGVILKQIKNEARNQVAKDFHVLKHNEVLPKMEYKSCWLNLNEKLDDIDKECGISWYFRCLHSGSQERVEQDLQHRSDNEGLHEHLPVFSNEQFLPVTDHNYSPSKNIAAQTNMEIEYSISIENASTDKTSSVISAAAHCLEQDLQEVSSASQEIMLSNSNPPQDTVSQDEEISVERFEEMTNNSAHTIQSMLPDTPYKPPITGHDRCAMEIVSKTPAEVQTSSELKKNSSDSRSVHGNSPDSFNEKSRADANCSPKLQDVVPEETSCQPNAINPLKAISHLVKTLDDQVVSKRRSSAGTSGRARLYGGRAVQVNEPTLKSSAHATQSAFQEGNGHQGAKAVNRVRVEEQLCLELKNKNSDSESCGLLTEMGDNRLLKSKSVVAEQTHSQPNTVNSLEGIGNVLRTKSDISLRLYENQIRKQEVLKRTGSGGRSPNLTKLLMQRDFTSSPKVCPTVAEQRAQIQNESNEKLTNSDYANKTIDKPSITERDQCAVEMVNEEPAEQQIPFEHVKNVPGFVNEQSGNNCSMKRKRMDTEQSSHQPIIENPQAGIVCTLEKRVALKKRNPNIFKRKHEHSAQMSRRDVPSVLTEPNIQSGCTNSSKLNPVIEQQQQKAVPSPQMQNECDETMPNGAETDEINVRPHKVAKQCFSSEMTEGEDLERDTATPSEMMHAPSWLNSEQCDNADKQCDSSSSSRSFHDAPKLLQEEHVMASFEDEPKNSAHVAQNTSLELDKPPEDLLERMHDSAVSETVRLDGAVCNGTDESTSENNLSPPKLDPVEFVLSPQMQSESSEPLLNENVMCETVTEPCTEVALHVNTEECEMDALASIKINVLPHEIAEQWFAGKMTEDKDFVKDTDVHASSKDQEDVEVLDHSDDQVEIEILDHSDDQIKMLFSEKHREDIKPIERHNPGPVDVKLESYCCFDKWFQSLNYGDGSLCTCQVKTELSEQKIKIEARDTSAKMQTNEEGRVRSFSKNYGCMEIKTDALTNDENSSECTKELLKSHTEIPDDAAVDNIKTVKARPVSKEVFKAKKATSEQIKDEWPSKCVGDEHSEKENPSPDVKKRSETVCLSLYGSSNRRDGLIRNKRYKDSCEEPPETLKITISSHQKNDRRLSKKRKWDGSMETSDAMDIRKDMRVFLKSCDESKTPQVHKATPMKVSEVTNENALSSSTLTRKRFNPPHNAKRFSKKKQSLRTRQISMNNYIIRRKPVLKSKYELGNPALMPLQEGSGLEFKVLPSSFNFEDETELDSIQADTSSEKNEISYPEDKKAKRRKTIHATQDTWSFSPLKPKHIQSTDVSSSCSLFQEFKKRFQERKKEGNRLQALPGDQLKNLNVY